MKSEYKTDSIKFINMDVEGIRKKYYTSTAPKRKRSKLTAQQLSVLRDVYSKNKYICAKSRDLLSKMLNIDPNTIKIWFQNQRARNKGEEAESTSVRYESPPLVGGGRMQFLPQSCDQGFDVFQPFFGGPRLEWDQGARDSLYGAVCGAEEPFIQLFSPQESDFYTKKF